MAGGWSRDGAVQDQIDASVEDAVERVRSNISMGISEKFCVECDSPIPEPRRGAMPGVRLCITCQASLEAKKINTAGINRRGSKDSQLR